MVPSSPRRRSHPRRRRGKPLTRAAEREKGATFEVLDIREVGAERLDKGAKLGERCTARYDIAGQARTQDSVSCQAVAARYPPA